MSGKIAKFLMDMSGADEQNVAYIIAATINLNCETLRRMTGKNLHGPADALDLLMMIEIGLDKGKKPTALSPSAFAPKPKLTLEEEDKLLNAIQSPGGPS